MSRIVQPLPEEIILARRQRAIQRILDREPTSNFLRNSRVAGDRINDAVLSPYDRRNLYFAANNPSNSGKLFAAGLAGLAAPYLAAKYSDNKLLQFMSIPLAALGGASLFDTLYTKTPSHFTPVFPMEIK